jgi:Flp pilus assembly protein TadG
MHAINNERGSVLIFVTLSIVLLLVMVGMGLDTGHLVYVRAQGQAAVDAAALAASSAIPTNSPTEVNDRAGAFNSKNDMSAALIIRLRVRTLLMFSMIRRTAQLTLRESV